MTFVAHVACPHDCPDSCLMDVTIDDGRAVKITANKEHPFTRGALCAKVNKFLDRVYSPDRLLYPVKVSDGKVRAHGSPASRGTRPSRPSRRR